MNNLLSIRRHSQRTNVNASGVIAKIIIQVAAFLSFALNAACSLSPSKSDISRSIELFPLEDVRLLESPFKQAQDKNIEYILAMQPDKLLAPFLKEAGLEPKAANYGNWESQGLDGHIGGHYLTALSLAYAATGDERLKQRLEYMLTELGRAQEANGNGYIGGVARGQRLWQELAKGDIRADLFALNDYWVPWYNLHKTYAGLRDAYWYTGSEHAKSILRGLGEWTIRLTKDLSSEQIEHMLTTEYGGMNEVLADMAMIFDDSRYVILAEQFSHKKILDPLLRSKDELNGLHANTQIPKVVGFQRVAEVTNKESWHQAADYFWHQVVDHRTVAIGGNSVREHFHNSSDFSPMINDVEGPETCNTYNMLKLSRMLFSVDPQGKYVDYFERALYNHILSSQHPDTGGLVYFTPMRPQHYRMYSEVDSAMWCCVGSGIENHVKYGEFIYAKRNAELFVNLFIPSTLKWKEQGVSITQRNQFPSNNTTHLTVDGNATFTLMLRYPNWVKEGGLRVEVNGVPFKIASQPGQYIAIPRNWKAGDTVAITFDMGIELEPMPDQSDYYAVVFGPVVLAAKTQPFENETLNVFSDDSRMGHIAQGPMCSLEAAPVFVSDTREFADKIQRVSDEELVFRAPNLILPKSFNDLELIPFYRLHDSRYMLYWPFSTPSELSNKQRRQAEAERVKLELDAQTIDKVAPGEQQPEADHFFEGERTEAGVHKGRHWRHAHGWFSYWLNDPKREAKTLRVTYYGLDAGRMFSIWINTTKLADVTLTGEQGESFYSVDYPIPPSIVSDAKEGRLKLTFKAGGVGVEANGAEAIVTDGNHIAGGIYGVRLLR